MSVTKYHILLILSFLCCKLNAQPENKPLEVSITSFGELGEYRYTFNKDHFIEKKTALAISDSSKTKLKQKDWRQLKKVINLIKLDSIEFYNSSTNHAGIDGDWYSNIEVRKYNLRYRTPNYDASNPNHHLITLDSTLWTLSKKYSKISWELLYEKARKEPTGNYTEAVYQIVEQNPEFPGGKDSLSSYIQKRLLNYDNTNGKAFIKAVVDKEGQLANIELVKASNELIGNAALSIVREMPLWIPGKQRGQNVNVQVIIPVGLD